MTESEKDKYYSFYKVFQQKIDLEWIQVVKDRPTTHMVADIIHTTFYDNKIRCIMGLFETVEIIESER